MSETKVRRFVAHDGDNGVTIESDDIGSALYEAKIQWIDGDWETREHISLSIQEVDEDDEYFGETLTDEFEVGPEDEVEAKVIWLENPAEKCGADDY